MTTSSPSSKYARVAPDPSPIATRLAPSSVSSSKHPGVPSPFGADIVPVPNKSPGRRLHPVDVCCAIICAGVQYRCRRLLRATGARGGGGDGDADADAVSDAAPPGGVSPLSRRRPAPPLAFAFAFAFARTRTSKLTSNACLRVEDGVERRRGVSGLNARGGRRDAPGNVLKDRRSPRQRGRTGTSVTRAYRPPPDTATASSNLAPAPRTARPPTRAR
eukprot:30947-Pelagococcus_subviridis.AAC.10